MTKATTFSPDVDLPQRVRAQRVHLVYRDQAFGLRADVDDHAVAVDADNRAFDDLAAPQ